MLLLLSARGTLSNLAPRAAELREHQAPAAFDGPPGLGSPALAIDLLLATRVSVSVYACDGFRKLIGSWRLSYYAGSLLRSV